jgi:hypothetical protein
MLTRGEMSFQSIVGRCRRSYRGQERRKIRIRAARLGRFFARLLVPADAEVEESPGLC